MTESEYVQMLRVVKDAEESGTQLKKSIAIMYGTDDVVSKAVGLFIMKPIFEKEGTNHRPLRLLAESVRCRPAGLTAQRQAARLCRCCRITDHGHPRA